MKNQQTALNALGFTEDWLQHGILSEDFLQELYAQIQVSDDKNQEHYRNYAFNCYLNRKDALSNEEIAVCFGLQDAGADLCDLRENRIFDVLHSGLLSFEQLEMLANHYPFIDEKPFQRAYRRLLISQQIERCGLTDDIFEQIKTSQDAVLQRKAIDTEHINAEQMTWLATHGSNKKIRNMAKIALKSHKFR